MATSRANLSGGLRCAALLAALVSWSLACEVVHPPDCSRQAPGSLHPHDWGCHLFYRCDELGTARAFACPPGKRFLMRGGELCAPEGRVPCNRCPRSAKEEGECTPTPPPCMTTTPPPCQTTTTAPCTTSTPDPTTTTRPPDPECPPSPSCNPTEVGMNKPYPPDCSLFLHCTLTGSQLWSCPPGQQFSPTQWRCMAPAEAQCPSCIPSYTTTERPTTSSPPFCPPEPLCDSTEMGKRKPYPPDCSLYMVCTEQAPMIVPCPPGKHFSPSLLTCMAPEVARCPLCIPLTPTPVPECPPTPSCGGEIGSMKPYPPDCSKFLNCTASGAELSSCPPTLHFSPTLLRCMLSSEANCPECIPDPGTTATPECPPTPSCSTPDIGKSRPYPPDCSKYIFCESASSALLLPCPAGQHFSPNLLSCMRPSLANCPDCIPLPTSTPDPGTTATPECPPTPSCSTPDIGKSKPYPPDCSKYIFCESASSALLLPCPVGEHFSPSLLSCMRPSMANCPDCIPLPTSTPDPGTTATPECPPTPSCSTPDIGKSKPYPPDCSKYIFCESASSALLLPCPVGEHFSPSLLSCMRPSLANCPDCIPLPTSTPDPGTTATPECPPTPSCSTPDIGKSKPYPPDCSKYIFCESASSALLLPCPVGEHFSPSLLSCMRPSMANCPLCVPGEEPTTTSSPPQVCPANPTCSLLDLGVSKPYPEDCTKYLYCFLGLYEIRGCALNFHFSPSVLKCMPRDRADCPLCIPHTTPTTETTLAPTPPPVCPETSGCSMNENGVKKPYPPDCSRYIHCKFGVASMKSCLRRHHFSPTKLQCMPIDKADCPLCIPHTTPEPSPTSEITTTSPPICPENPTCAVLESGSKPYPPDCTRYISCLNGNATIRSCSENQHFSPTDLLCMAIEDAGCPYCIAPTPTPTFTPTSTPEPTPTTTPDPILPICKPIHACHHQNSSSRTGGTVGMYPYPPDCSKYIYCSAAEQPLIGSCREGFLFSPDLLHCVPAEMANCQECRPNPLPVCKSVEVCRTPERPSRTGGLVNMYPYPPDCTRYIYCSVEEEPILASCRDGFHFSPDYLHCMPEHLANCTRCAPDPFQAPYFKHRSLTDL